MCENQILQSEFRISAFINDYTSIRYTVFFHVYDVRSGEVRNGRGGGGGRVINLMCIGILYLKSILHSMSLIPPLSLPYGVRHV